MMVARMTGGDGGGGGGGTHNRQFMPPRMQSSVVLKAGATFGGWGLAHLPEPRTVVSCSEAHNHRHEDLFGVPPKPRCARLYTLHYDIYRKVMVGCETMRGVALRHLIQKGFHPHQFTHPPIHLPTNPRLPLYLSHTHPPASHVLILSPLPQPLFAITNPSINQSSITPSHHQFISSQSQDSRLPRVRNDSTASRRIEQSQPTEGNRKSNSNNNKLLRLVGLLLFSGQQPPSS